MTFQALSTHGYPSRSEEVEICRACSFPPFPLTHIQKNYLVIVRRLVFVCVSVCLLPQKSAVTFDSLNGSAQTFRGPLNSSQVIFGWVFWTFASMQLFDLMYP